MTTEEKQNTETFTVESSRKLIERDREKRLNTFFAEYQELCKKYRCEWRAEVVSIQVNQTMWANSPRLYIFVDD